MHGVKTGIRSKHIKTLQNLKFRISELRIWELNQWHTVKPGSLQTDACFAQSVIQPILLCTMTVNTLQKPTKYLHMMLWFSPEWKIQAAYHSSSVAGHLPDQNLTTPQTVTPLQKKLFVVCICRLTRVSLCETAPFFCPMSHIFFKTADWLPFF